MQQIDRLIEYFQAKGFKRFNKIEEFVGLGRGTISAAKRRQSNLRGDTIELIQKKCPDLSMEWLINGVGEMINSKTNTTLINKAVENQQLKAELHKQHWLNQPALAEDQKNYGTNWKEKYIETLESYNDLLKKYTELLEASAGYQKTGTDN